MSKLELRFKAPKTKRGRRNVVVGSRSAPSAQVAQMELRGWHSGTMTNPKSALERIRFNPARIQLRRSSWHIRWA
jgi:hypothetical protein